MAKHPFEYQRPTADQTETIKAVRAQFATLHDLILLVVPNGRERAVAITNLQQASMWCNAAIVFGE